MIGIVRRVIAFVLLFFVKLPISIEIVVDGSRGMSEGQLRDV
jgi:hypothetical protein